MAYDMNELKGRIFSVDEVARLLGVKPDAIRRRVRLGQIPVRRPPGSEMFFSGDDLTAYLLGETPAPRPRRIQAKAEAKAVAVSVDPEPPTKAQAPAPSLFPEATATAPAAVIPFAFPPEANKRLNTFMERRGLTQKAVTEATGIASDKVSRIVHGKRNITRKTAAMLQSGYGEALVQYLLDGGTVPALEISR